MGRKKGGYQTYLKEDINKKLFLLEAGQGKHINGNVFALLKCLETDERWKSYKPCLAVLKDNKDKIEQRLKDLGFTKTKTVVRNSNVYKKALATSAYLVTDNSFPTYFIKREGQVYLNTWHGTPLKQLGRADIVNSTSIGNVQKNFLAADYLLSPNTYTRDIMMKDYMMERVFSGKTVVCDYPRNDALFDEGSRIRIREKYDLKKGHIFAYMPTWRGTGRNADIDSQIEDAKATIRCIESALGSEDVLYVNFHFLIGDRLDYSEFTKVRPFPAEYETYEFLNACDTLISDYSSVMIDFAQTERNVIMYMYDYEEYAAQKGFYFDIRELPFEKAYEEEDLAKAIATASVGEMKPYELDSALINPYRGNGSNTVLNMICKGDEPDSSEVKDYSESKDTKVLYAGDLSSEANCKLTKKIINELTEEEKENTVIAFESEVEGNTVKFLQDLDEKIDFLRIPGKGQRNKKERVALYLNRNYSLMAGISEAYYRREYDRLFRYINCQEISLINTDMFYRIGTMTAGDKISSIHKVPLEFYNRPNEVFYSHPKALDRTYGRFDKVIEHGRSFCSEAWQNGKCEGIRAILKKLSISTAKQGEAKLKMTIDVSMQAPGLEPKDKIEISSKVYGNVLTYDVHIDVIKKVLHGNICKCRLILTAEFPAAEFENWYSSNMISIQMAAGDDTYLVPLMSDRKSKVPKRRVMATGNPNQVCEMKEDFRFSRLMIRDANVSDRTGEKVKLFLAYLAAKATFWHKPALLFEKDSSRYEESASILFEKLIDIERKDIRFILDRNYVHRDEIEKKYRKYIVNRFSFSHYYNMFAAESIISSEAPGHALEKKCANRLFKKHVLNGKKNYVFLQHGVMYMVSLSAEQRNFFKKSEAGGKQRVVVSSELEANHFIDNTNYTEDDLYVCGLLKFDRSVRNEDADRIVIMTTWRPWEYVTGKSNIENTGYYSLLKLMVESVPDTLKDKVVVLPHPLVEQQIEENLESYRDDPVWKYFVSGQKYDEILKETKVLMTDYSSIAYDAFYRGSSIVFCWRDKDSCMKEYGKNAHLMLTEELAFGDVCMNMHEIANSVAKAYEEVRPKAYESNFKKIVEFDDNKNTDRFITMAKKDGIL